MYGSNCGVWWCVCHFGSSVGGVVVYECGLDSNGMWLWWWCVCMYVCVCVCVCVCVRVCEIRVVIVVGWLGSGGGCMLGVVVVIGWW